MHNVLVRFQLSDKTMFKFFVQSFLIVSYDKLVVGLCFLLQVLK